MLSSRSRDEGPKPAHPENSASHEGLLRTLNFSEQLSERGPVIHDCPEKYLTIMHSDILAHYIHYFIK